jgi:hypothetical protein
MVLQVSVGSSLGIAKGRGAALDCQHRSPSTRAAPGVGLALDRRACRAPAARHSGPRRRSIVVGELAQLSRTWYAGSTAGLSSTPAATPGGLDAAAACAAP